MRLKKFSSVVLGTVILLLACPVMLLAGPLYPARAVNANATTYICTIYIPSDLGVDNQHRSHLMEGIEKLLGGSEDEAIDAFLDVINDTDKDDIQNYIARNNLVCAYLRKANVSVANADACYYISEAMHERSALISSEIEIDFDGL